MSGISICGGLWIAFFVVWMVWAIRTKPTQTRESVSSRLSYTVLTVAGFYMMFSGDAPRGWLRIRLFAANPWTAALGVAATAAGLGFAVWARAYLGTNWSGTVTVKVGHQLVKTGPYRWVRHPIYSGLILAMLGTALERRQARGVVAVALLYAGFKIKSRIEERTMTNTFGAEYDDYSRSTGAIVPKLRL
ncbi:MAG: isoprenylcysteine carboxylmethyltransferase family protein [Candidatus Korobacteraceae bacterium]